METSIPRVVAVLGRGVLTPGSPLVPADDLGFTRGDGCFDALRVVRDAEGVRVDHATRHLERFARSAAAMGLPPIDVAAWTGLVHEAAEAWEGEGEAVCKVIWTRGGEFVASDPVGVALVAPVPGSCVPLRVAALTTGRRADAFRDAPWLLGGVKTISYATNAAAKREAARRGADDAVFVSSDGYLLEGPTSALVVARHGLLDTTPTAHTGILPSVTLAVIAEHAAAAGREVRERLMKPEELGLATGVWLVSAIRGVCPVVELDGRPLPFNPRITRTLARWAGFAPAEG
ncbi:aminodeoxychorismate lyase [Propioniciclava soli]|uniref:Aminodeoxychorismate lyase n=1 Tax=Propioniciclava soli TaxID=2775081 RepID=A0ABZ3C4U0_9ACTN|nr:aminodeoxychorismate lyase [Propioniciclava soli]